VEKEAKKRNVENHTGTLKKIVDSKISPADYAQLKLKPLSSLDAVETLEELRYDTQRIVIAQAAHTFGINSTGGDLFNFEAGGKYVMSVKTYSEVNHIRRGGKKVRMLKPTKPLFCNIYKPYTGQNLEGKTLLVERPGGIGDLCFIQPNLIHLKTKYPTCHIAFACRSQYHDMLKTWGCIDELIALPFSFKYLLNSDYHAVFEGVLERCAEAKMVNAYELFSEWLGLRLPIEELRPTQEALSEYVEKVEGFLKQWNLEKGSFVVLQTRASSPIRTMSLELTKKLIKALLDEGYKVVITDSVHGADLIDSALKDFPDKPVYNFARHSTSIGGAIALISLSKGVVSCDSAAIHLGVSLDVPVFGIYGAFPGHTRMSTYGPTVDWIDCEAACAPCFKHGYATGCPETWTSSIHAKCLDNLDISAAMIKIKALM